MGQSASKQQKEAFLRLRERVNTMPIAEMLQHLPEGENEIMADDTIELAVAKLTNSPGNSAVVYAPGEGGEKREVVGVFDIFSCLGYLLRQYRGSLEKVEQKVVHTEYDPFFWGGYDQWVEKRTALVPTVQASEILYRGAEHYFSESVADVLAADEEQLASRIAPLSMAVDTRCFVSHVLPVLSQGYSSVPVRNANGAWSVLSSHSLLSVLHEGVLKTNLQGLGDMKVKHHLTNHPLLICRAGDRALLALMRMQQWKLSAIPVLDKQSSRVLQEFSVHAISAVHANNFAVLMSSVGHVLEAVDPLFHHFSVPVTTTKKATLAQVINLMWKNNKTQVWIVNKANELKGVVSLSNIMQIIHSGVVHPEGTKKRSFKKSDSMKGEFQVL